MTYAEKDGHIVQCVCSYRKLSRQKILVISELQENTVILKFRITVADGKSYSTNHYSLEMIMVSRIENQRNMVE